MASSFHPLPPLADELHTRYVERKVAATVAAASIKLPSPAPATVPVLPQRTRLAQQQSHRASPARGRQAQPEPPGPDEDAEGDDDVEEGNGDEDEDNEDKTLYCFCQKMSYGEVRSYASYCVSSPHDKRTSHPDGCVRQHGMRISMGKCRRPRQHRFVC